MIRPAALALPGLLATLAAAEARPCRSGETPSFAWNGRPSCDAGETLKPYDPTAPRAGRQPGSIDLGNGTEVRVGGRVQMEYDGRRR
jgi:hypothetical protein